MTQQSTTVVKTIETLLLSVPRKKSCKNSKFNNAADTTRVDKLNSKIEKDAWFLWKQFQLCTKKIRQAKVNIYDYSSYIL